MVREAEKGIKFEFSQQMVNDWSASITPTDHDDGLFESFMKFVSSREQRSIHSQSQQKRIGQLVDSMIAKKKLPPVIEELPEEETAEGVKRTGTKEIKPERLMRDALTGEVELPAGFDKNTGLKGSKLSGG